MCVYTAFISQWLINCNHQHLKVTTNTTVALLHLTWQRGHYMLQQVFRDGFSFSAKFSVLSQGC